MYDYVHNQIVTTENGSETEASVSALRSGPPVFKRTYPSADWIALVWLHGVEEIKLPTASDGDRDGAMKRRLDAAHEALKTLPPAGQECAQSYIDGFNKWWSEEQEARAEYHEQITKPWLEEKRLKARPASKAEAA